MDGTLVQQMDSLGVGEVASHGRKKKKDRHAHHTVEAPSSAAFGAISPGIQGIRSLSTGNTEPTPQFAAAHNNTFSAQPVGAVSPSPGDGFARVQGSNHGRVNPDDVPGISHLRDGIAQHYLTNPYLTMEHHVPPPAVTPFVALDQGNASPKFARLTLNSIPSTAEALQSTALPLGLVLQPLAPLQPGEVEVPVLDFGDAGPPRCHRCRAYINPFMIFRSGGNRFVCNMCNYANDVSPEYFCATTPQGSRLDREQRPELMCGTVEFLVPKEYWSKEPVALHWLFVIDVGQEAYNKGFLAGVCNGILQALYGNEVDTDSPHQLDPGVKVGFVSYDKDVHFYNMSVSSANGKDMKLIKTAVTGSGADAGHVGH